VDRFAARPPVAARRPDCPPPTARRKSCRRDAGGSPRIIPSECSSTGPGADSANRAEAGAGSRSRAVSVACSAQAANPGTWCSRSRSATSVSPSRIAGNSVSSGAGSPPSRAVDRIERADRVEAAHGSVVRVPLEALLVEGLDHSRLLLDARLCV
jgi:hypothetical protein